MTKKIIGVATILMVICFSTALVFAPPGTGWNPWELRLEALESQMEELQSQVDALDTYTETLETRIGTLETDLNDLAIAHSYRLKPDFDSGLVELTPGTPQQIDANFPGQFWNTRYLFHLMGHDSGDPELTWHQYNLGTDATTSEEVGVEIIEVTENYLVVRRGAQDTKWDEIRIFGWYLPTGTELFSPPFFLISTRAYTHKFQPFSGG